MNTHKVFLAKPQTKRALERPRPEREDNIRSNTDAMCVCVWSSFSRLRIGFNGRVFKDGDEALPSKEVVNFLTMAGIIDTQHSGFS